MSGELPPASYFNWLANSTYQWLQYIANVLSSNDGSWSLANSVTSAAVAAFRVLSTPEDGGAGNAHKPILTFNAGSGRPVTLWSGKLATGTVWVITSNMTWDVGSQQWQIFANGKRGSAVIMDEAFGLSTYDIAAGTPPFSTWPDSSGRVTSHLIKGADGEFTGTVLANVIDATTLQGDTNCTDKFTFVDMECTNIAQFHALSADSAVDLTDAIVQVDGAAPFTYPAPITVTRMLGLDAGCGGTGIGKIPAKYATGAGFIFGDNSSTSEWSITLPLPENCTLTRVRLLYTSNTAGGVSFNVFKHIRALPGGANSVSMRIAGAVSNGGAGTEQILTFTPDQNLGYSKDAETVSVVITLGDVDDQVYGVEYRYTTDRPSVRT